MNILIDQRCFHHASREAVVRCPECRRFFCRECVTEHRGRMVCAGCIGKMSAPPTGAGRFATALWIAASFGGVLVAWLIFYNLGVMLARITPDFLQ
ncbi:MAG TPA: hypothetical protein VK419_12830 [Bryobacteraceae bacterium]|nr:hypothetical protein [Bryobacteraceae bacterium]